MNRSTIAIAVLRSILEGRRFQPTGLKFFFLYYIITESIKQPSERDETFLRYFETEMQQPTQG